MPNEKQRYIIGVLYVAGSAVALLIAMLPDGKAGGVFAAACGMCFLHGAQMMNQGEQNEQG